MANSDPSAEKMLRILASIYMLSLVNGLIVLVLEGLIPESPSETVQGEGK